MNLMTFEFNFDEKFYPSKSTKDLSLYTYKKTHTPPECIKLPGLFQTTGFIWQMLGVALIIVFEISATLKSLDLGVKITVIIVSIVIDFFLALWSHWWHDKICRLENENVYEDAVKVAQNENKLFSLKARRNIFYFLIFVSAGVKCYWFRDAHHHDFTSDALQIYSFYSIAAGLHCLCTGYFVYSLTFWAFITWEHRQYVSSGATKHIFDPAPLEQPIANNAIALEKVEDGHQQIIERTGAYYFSTKGILTDKELRMFISRQKNKLQRVIVAQEGVKHQIRILNQ